jgi:hypothetical protein
MENTKFKASEVEAFASDPEDGLDYISEMEPTPDNFKAEASNIVEDFEMSGDGNKKFIETIDELIQMGKITTWTEFGAFVDGVVIKIQNAD